MRIAKLDGLRGVFSVMVVFYHYPKEFTPPFFHDFFLVAKSYLFVDFFFVLSGFVIAYNYNNKINSKTELGLFMRKRIIRLYPLLLYTTLVFLLVTVGVKVLLPQLATNKDSFLPAFIDTLSTLLFLNSTPIFYDNFGGNPYGMNFPTWSISAEMFAYVFFAIVTLWALTRKKNLILACSNLLGIVFFLIKELLEIPGNWDFVHAIISFNIGYFVFLYAQKGKRVGNGWEILLLIMFFGSIYLASVVEDGLMIVFVDACFMPFFFGFFIFTLLHTDGIISQFMETKPFQFLGKISYSIYLNHAIVITILPKALFSILKLQPSVTMEMTILAFNVLVILLYSTITYDIIEVKGGNLVNNLALRRRLAVIYARVRSRP